MTDHFDLVKQWLVEEEGFSATPYRCPAGKTTIGYGWNMDDNPASKELAEMILSHHISKCTSALYDFLEDDFAKLSPTRKAVLIDLCYWIGIKSVSTFARMLRAIQLGKFDVAADELLDSKLGNKYPKRTGALAERLRKE